MKLVVPAYIKDRMAPLSSSEVSEKLGYIKTAIDSIYTQKEMSMDYKTIFDTCFKLVTNKRGKEVYDRVSQSIEQHTKGICGDVNTNTDETFLSKLLAVWEKYRKAVSKIRDLLMYLDEQYVDKNQTHEKKILPVYDLGISIFRQDVLIKLAKRVQRLIIQIVTKERDGELVANKFMLKNLTHMMVEVDKEKVYTEIFEKEFMRESRQYYTREAQRYFETSTAVMYLNRVKQRMSEEIERATRCFDPDTKQKIEDVVKDEMIDKYKDLVVKKDGSGVKVMLENKREEELALVYEVLSLVSGALKPTIEMVKEYAIQEGEKIINDKEKDEKPKNLVMEVIDLRVYFDHLLLKSFSYIQKGTRVRDKEFSRAIKEAFDHCINCHKRFPEYLSLLVDSKIASGDSEKLDVFFDNVIMVFRHVSEKDVFEKYYKTHLAKRLLSSKNFSDDDEKVFLGKLKAEFGYQFTSKLEGMFKDVKVSAELMNEWKSHVESTLGDKKPFDLTVDVLTLVYWPVAANAKLTVFDPSMQKITKLFSDFYTAKHQGRKITWQYNMGNADIRMNGFSKPYELNCSTYQMAILLIFNEEEKFSTQEIGQKTSIPNSDLLRELSSLLLPVSAADKQSKVLTLEQVSSAEETSSGGTEKKKKKVLVDSHTIFKPNEAFKSSKIKTKTKEIGGGKVSTQKYNEEEEKILEERKWVTDAVIVRIMKMRKRRDHRDLVNEVVEQLHQRFPATAAFIKKRIENLIDRDYLERAEGSRNVYNYVA